MDECEIVLTCYDHYGHSKLRDDVPTLVVVFEQALPGWPEHHPDARRRYTLKVRVVWLEAHLDSKLEALKHAHGDLIVRQNLSHHPSFP